MFVGVLFLSFTVPLATSMRAGISVIRAIWVSTTSGRTDELSANHSANWATTDAICGALIGPLIVVHPELAPRMRGWARDPNMWVRRAAAVALIPSVRQGRALDLAYEIARRMHPDKEDLIQKAVGWMLREAGKPDPGRLERYLRANGPSIPRTTLRYAIERFPVNRRKSLLKATRHGS